jgi:hypothetical protein
MNIKAASVEEVVTTHRQQTGFGVRGNWDIIDVLQESDRIQSTTFYKRTATTPELKHKSSNVRTNAYALTDALCALEASNKGRLIEHISTILSTSSRTTTVSSLKVTDSLEIVRKYGNKNGIVLKADVSYTMDQDVNDESWCFFFRSYDYETKITNVSMNYKFLEFSIP